MKISEVLGEPRRRTGRQFLGESFAGCWVVAMLASDEMAEWARRSQNTTGRAAKYPRPVDSARNRYEYYAHEADEAAFQADKYNRFAAGAAATAHK